MTIIEGVDASQNVRLDYSNTAITIIQGVDTSQNVRLDYSNTAITIIQGVDVGQNARMTIIEGVDASQNVRLDYSNTAITIIQGVDVSQNARMTIIEGVDVTQNTNIANKLSLTGALNQTVSGNVTIGSDLIVSGNLVITGNVNSQNVQQLSVADPLIVLGIGNYVSDTKDIGFAAHYNDGTNAHAGLFRDSGTKEFYVFQGYTPEVDAVNNIVITDPTFRTANLNASYVKGNLVATTAVVGGLDVNSRLDFSNTRMTIIDGVDSGQNSRMTIIESTDVSQNVRLDYSNTAITIIQGVDVSQNARMLVIENTDVSQNARMTIIEGTNVTQNNNIQTALTVANNALPNVGSLITVNSSSQVYVSNTQTSTSTTTGALTVAGGTGIAGNVNIGKELNVLGSGKVDLSPSNYNVYLQPTGAGLVTIAPASKGSIDNMTIGLGSSAGASFTYASITNTTLSTSTTTGALTVSGGVGIRGEVYSRTGIPDENYLLYTPRVTVTAGVAPTGPRIGDIWIDASVPAYLQYIKDGTSTFWIQVGAV
jgi:cytoskeletal protein CcmA (bactofilin family)